MGEPDTAILDLIAWRVIFSDLKGREQKIKHHPLNRSPSKWRGEKEGGKERFFFGSRTDATIRTVVQSEQEQTVEVSAAASSSM